MAGLERNDCEDLYCLEDSKCIKPTNLPASYAQCIVMDVDFVGDVTKTCPVGFYLAGLKRGSGNRLSDIDSFYCCR